MYDRVCHELIPEANKHNKRKRHTRRGEIHDFVSTVILQKVEDEMWEVKDARETCWKGM